MIQKFIWLGLAGALGTLSRYLLTDFIHRYNSTSFPWGTVAVNLIGCFLAGLLWTLFESRWSVTAEIRTLVLIGFMGAFTTFSTLILESSELFHSAEWIKAATNITMQNGLGFFALFLGTSLGRMV